jgi:hypothetical protein
MNAIGAPLETGRLRLRQVFLAAFTTILGLIPMVLAMNIDLINRSVSFGAPSTQWWTQLASAIAGGLFFATLLMLTTCLLVLGDRASEWICALPTRAAAIFALIRERGSTNSRPDYIHPRVANPPNTSKQGVSINFAQATERIIRPAASCQRP